MAQPKLRAVAVALALIVTLPGCKDSASKNRPPAPKRSRSTQPAAQPSSLTVAVDPRVELFSILFRMAGAPEYGRAPATSYSAAVDAHFAAFANHPAVVASRELRSAHSISWDAPMTMAVYLDPVTFVPLRPLSPLPPGLDSRWQKAPVDAYLAKVRDFATATEFGKFLAANRAYTDAVEERLRTALAAYDITGWLQEFFASERAATFIAVPGLLTGTMNYHAGATDEAGNERSYQIIMLENLDERGLPTPSATTVALLAHEMTHGYVNPLVEANLAAFAPVAQPIFARVEPAMTRAAYGAWKFMVFESLVRATTLLFSAANLDPATTMALLREDEAIGFLWMAELTDHLAARRKARGDKPFATDIASVVTLFADLDKRYRTDGLPRPPFRGPINGAFAPEGLSRLAVLTPENGALVTYGKQIHAMVKANGPVQAATRTKLADLDSRSVLLYGTPQDNPAVAETIGAAKIQLAADKIVIGERAFPGTNLVLIACRPHPIDPTHSVVVYTGQDERDIVGINMLSHGPSDWVVGRRVGPNKYERVAHGFFIKERSGAWTSQTVVLD